MGKQSWLCLLFLAISVLQSSSPLKGSDRIPFGCSKMRAVQRDAVAFLLETQSKCCWVSNDQFSKVGRVWNMSGLLEMSSTMPSGIS